MRRVACAIAAAGFTLVGGLNVGPSRGGAADAQTVVCSNPSYKAAELAAYQAMVKAQEDARQAARDAITKIEKENKERLLRLDGRKSDPDNPKWIERSLVARDADLYRIQGDEADAIKQAQATYLEKREEARQQFCGDEPTDPEAMRLNRRQMEKVRQALMRLAAYVASIH